MNDFYEELYGENLYTYRLSDGSYLIAEELDVDENNGAIYIANPLELIRDSSTVKLRPWVVVDQDDIIELNSSTIISRSNTSKILISFYLKYIAYEKLITNISNIDKDLLNQDNNDELDNLDSIDDFFSKLNKSSECRWDWKAN
jgi:hypothetical protein